MVVVMVVGMLSEAREGRGVEKRGVDQPGSQTKQPEI